MPWKCEDTMRSDLRRRLLKLETNEAASAVTIWINTGHGIVRSPDGQTMSQADFDATHPDAVRFTVNVGNAIPEPESRTHDFDGSTWPPRSR